MRYFGKLVHLTGLFVGSGVCADEVHVCGEEAGVDLVRDLTVATGDTFEVKSYKRLTKLKILDRGIGRLLITRH